MMAKENRGWTQSEPPRGSGWVRSQTSDVVVDGFAPIRYREVVLTVSKCSALFEAKIKRRRGGSPLRRADVISG
jgi:hypothetical protein